MKRIIEISDDDYEQLGEVCKSYHATSVGRLLKAIYESIPLTERNSYCKSCINRYEPIDGFRCRNCTLKPSMYEYNKELDNETDN